MLELYVCRLLYNVELTPEPDGNELIWVSTEALIMLIQKFLVGMEIYCIVI